MLQTLSASPEPPSLVEGPLRCLRGLTPQVTRAWRRRARRFVLTSSIAAYGLQPGPIDETTHSTAEDSPIGYLRTKFLAEREVRALEPILPGDEESTVKVPAGFDPSAIRLTGNVTGQPPFQGVLKHHGWRVKGYRLPAPPAGIDELVVAPAEVELP